MSRNKQCEYTDFTTENNDITFGDSEVDEGILISIPFADDTPKSIKARLNGMINYNMDVWSRNNDLVGHILEPEHLLLNARMQIRFYGGGESYPFYCISMVISDFHTEVGNSHEVWIDDTYNIGAETSEFRMEFKRYCQDKLDKVLFPVEGY